MKKVIEFQYFELEDRDLIPGPIQKAMESGNTKEAARQIEKLKGYQEGLRTLDDLVMVFTGMSLRTISEEKEYDISSDEIFPYLEIALRAGGSVHHADKHGGALARSPRLSARCASLLLEYGADPNEKGSFSFTPLCFALISEDPALVRVLLDNGADPNIKSTLGLARPTWFWSFSESVSECLPMLFDCGAAAFDEDGARAIDAIERWVDVGFCKINRLNEVEPRENKDKACMKALNFLLQRLSLDKSDIEDLVYRKRGSIQEHAAMVVNSAYDHIVLNEHTPGVVVQSKGPRL